MFGQLIILHHLFKKIVTHYGKETEQLYDLKFHQRHKLFQCKRAMDANITFFIVKNNSNLFKRFKSIRLKKKDITKFI